MAIPWHQTKNEGRSNKTLDDGITDADLPAGRFGEGRVAALPDLIAGPGLCGNSGRGDRRLPGCQQPVADPSLVDQPEDAATDIPSPRPTEPRAFWPLADVTAFSK